MLLYSWLRVPVSRDGNVLFRHLPRKLAQCFFTIVYVDGPRNETLQPDDFLVLGQNNGTRQSCLSNVQKDSIAENAL